jgi:methylthioribose-1-phosphate isomerase
MVIRGAPAIGVAAAMGVALGALHASDRTFDREFERIVAVLGKTRPTAVNLFWALERMRAVYYSQRANGLATVRRGLKNAALQIF